MLYKKLLPVWQRALQTCQILNAYVNAWSSLLYSYNSIWTSCSNCVPEEIRYIVCLWFRRLGYSKIKCMNWAHQMILSNSVQLFTHHSCEWPGNKGLFIPACSNLLPHDACWFCSAAPRLLCWTCDSSCLAFFALWIPTLWLWLWSLPSRPKNQFLTASSLLVLPTLCQVTVTVTASGMLCMRTLNEKDNLSCIHESWFDCLLCFIL